MAQVFIPQEEDWKNFKETLARIEKNVSNINTQSQKSILTEKELTSMLGICSKTLQKYRNEGLISFIKIERKIFYKIEDVNEFMEKNYFKAFRST